MHAGDEGDLGDVAMPGFVDILSSVVTVFMFFMLITSVTMFFLSLKMKKTVVEESKKEAQINASKELADYLRKIQSGEISLQELSAKVDDKSQIRKLSQRNEHLNESLTAAEQQVQQMRSTLGKSVEQKVEMSQGSSELVILYDDNGITVSAATKKQIQSFLETIAKNPALKGKNLALEAPDNPNAPTLSVAREIALGRALNVRNVLLLADRAADQVIVSNVVGQKYNNTYNWLRIRIMP